MATWIIGKVHKDGIYKYSGRGCGCHKRLNVILANRRITVQQVKVALPLDLKQ